MLQDSAMMIYLGIFCLIILVTQVGHLIMDLKDIRARKQREALYDADRKLLIKDRRTTQRSVRVVRGSNSTPLRDMPDERRKSG